jgi:hypothetical protein
MEVAAREDLGRRISPKSTHWEPSDSPELQWRVESTTTERRRRRLRKTGRSSVRTSDNQDRSSRDRSSRDRSSRDRSSRQHSSRDRTPREELSQLAPSERPYESTVPFTKEETERLMRD